MFIFLVADGTVKLAGGDKVLETSTLIPDSPDRGEGQGNLPGPVRATLFVLITWNPESNTASQAIFSQAVSCALWLVFAHG